MSLRISSSLSVLALGLTAAMAEATAASPLGVWIDHTGRGAVEIVECSSGVCGRVVWIKSAKDQEGCNLQILGGLKVGKDGRTNGGWIWDPEGQRKYDVELTPVGADKLRVLGYAGIKMFGETFTWTKAPPNLERCDAPKRPAAAIAQAEPTKPEPAKPLSRPVIRDETRAVEAPTAPRSAAEEPIVRAAPASPAQVTAPRIATPRAEASTNEPPPVSQPPASAAPIAESEMRQPQPTQRGEPKARKQGFDQKQIAEALGSMVEQRTVRGKKECTVRIPDFASLKFPCEGLLD